MLTRAKTFLGIEGGATRSTAALLNEHGRVLKHAEGGPCNLLLLNDVQILRLWRQFDRELMGVIFNRDSQKKSHQRSRLKVVHSMPTAVGIFLAGNRRPVDAARMTQLAKRIWKNSRVITGNDAQLAMASALSGKNGIVLICGTGSIVLAQKGRKTSQVGGFGSLAGDAGSGYWMGRELLRGMIRRYDQTGKLDSLGKSLLKFLGKRNLEEIVQWTISPSRDEVASLTRVLFRHPNHPLSRRIIHEAAELLADDVALAAVKTGLRAPLVALNRGLAKHQPIFRRELSRAIRKKVRGVKVFLSDTDGAIGAAQLAMQRY